MALGLGVELAILAIVSAGIARAAWNLKQKSVQKKEQEIKRFV